MGPGPDEGGGLYASLTGLLPGDDGCEDLPAPVEPAGEPPSDPAPAFDACRLLTESTPDAKVRFLFERPPRGAGWWTWCGAEVDPPGDLHIFSRGRVTSNADGASYAASLFGQNVAAERMLGRTVYWNDCFDGIDNGTGKCTPSAAVVNEPHLIVVSWLGQSRADFRSWLERAMELGLIP